MQITNSARTLSKLRLCRLSAMFFLCTLLTSNNMILLQFGVKTLLNFSVFEKFTRAYLHQIALEIM